VKDDEIKNRWKEYFDKLFNDESEKIAIELENSVNTNRRFVRRIQESKVKEILQKNKTSKTVGPDDIPIEVWRCLGDITMCGSLSYLISFFDPIKCLMSGEEVY
jgi:hypothetical protein